MREVRKTSKNGPFLAKKSVFWKFDRVTGSKSSRNHFKSILRSKLRLETCMNKPVYVPHEIPVRASTNEFKDLVTWQSRDSDATAFFRTAQKSPKVYPVICRVAIGANYHGFLAIWGLNFGHVITWSRDLSEFSYFFIRNFNVIPTPWKIISPLSFTFPLSQ